MAISRRYLRWGVLALAALLALAGVVVLGANVAFGPGPAGLARLSDVLSGMQVPSAVLRLLVGLLALALWPRLLRTRARAAGWSDQHLKAVQVRDRTLIGAAIAFDVLVLNLPLWLNLIRG